MAAGQSTAQVISEARQAAAAGAQLRTGVVTAVDATTVTVDIGGGELPAVPYTDAYQPILGDAVQLLYQRGVWFCLGRSAGAQPGDALSNPSFDTAADTIGAAPSGWGIYHNPTGPANGQVTVEAAPAGQQIDGRQCLQVRNPSSTQQTYTEVYSEAIPVAAGQKWTAAAWYLGGGYPLVASVVLRLAFFDDGSDVYPNVDASTVSSVETSVLVGPPAVLLRLMPDAGIEIPAGINWARVVLTTVITPQSAAGSKVYWDRVIARRLS